MTHLEKLALGIVVFIALLALLVGFWRLATYDYCPIYYNITCLPK